MQTIVTHGDAPTLATLRASARPECVDVAASASPPVTASPTRVRFRWLIRPRRILLGVAALWVLNVFDLGYTLLETSRSGFVELNPVAARLVGGPDRLLVLYKTALVGVGSVILLALRRHRLAEMTCWLLLAVYALVGIRWNVYYNHLMTTPSDPAEAGRPYVRMVAP